MTTLTYKDAKEAWEKSYIIAALTEAKGNVSKAAKAANRNRTRFYGLINRHGIKPFDFREVNQETPQP